MKKVYLFLTMITLSLLSCSTEEAVVLSESGSVPKFPKEHYIGMWENYQNAQNAQRMGDVTTNLFTYTTPRQAADKLYDAIVVLEPEMRDELSSVAGAVEIVTRIRLVAGSAKVLDYHLIDGRGDVIESWEANPSTGVYVPMDAIGGALLSAFGSCPTGYTSLGFCFYGDGLLECMGTAQQNFTIATLTGVGSSMPATGMQTCGMAG